MVGDLSEAISIDNNIDLRLKLSIKREFFASKFSNLLPFNKYRRFHAYCIGTPRSGTHSIANVLQHSYAVAHEPRSYYAIYHLIKWADKKYTRTDIKHVLEWRDKKLALDLEAAHYLHHVADILADSFPNAKFILTVRDPLSWLESEINRNYSTRNKLFWRALEDSRYRRYHHRFTPHEKPLEQMGLFPIASYFSYWRDHNQFVLNTVPKERLLVMDTREIRTNPGRLADFLGVDVSTLDLHKSHANKRSKRFKLSELVNQQYLNQQLNEICADLIDSQLSFLKENLAYTG